MLSGNKGEWSEVYALLKLLGDGKLFSGDENLGKLEDLFYPIVKIIRSENTGNYEYELDSELVLITGGEETLRIPADTFKEQAGFLLQKIKSSTGAAFSIPEAESFINSIYCTGLKAKSNSKSDIKIVIHDLKIQQNVELGFSIKSQLGGEATLLNAGKTTNFVYKIDGFEPDETEISAINSIDTKSKIKDRIESIAQKQGILSFVGLEQDIFANNLTLIDSLLPHILAEILKIFFTSKKNTVYELTCEIDNRNPLKYDKRYAHKFYEYKIKKFLTDVALGMMPSKVWTGYHDATGGYLIVKETGDVLCYHIYNRNQFEDYLFHNTKLETASSTRHEFGQIYKTEDGYFFRLNLQIRFK